MSELPVLTCMRMILSMGSWYESVYNVQIQTVESGCILIVWTLIVRVRCTFVLNAKTFFVNQLTVVTALSITMYLYCFSISLFVIILSAILDLMFYHLIISTIQYIRVQLCVLVVRMHGNEYAILGIGAT